MSDSNLPLVVVPVLAASCTDSDRPPLNNRTCAKYEIGDVDLRGVVAADPGKWRKMLKASRVLMWEGLYAPSFFDQPDVDRILVLLSLLACEIFLESNLDAAERAFIQSQQHRLYHLEDKLLNGGGHTTEAEERFLEQFREDSKYWPWKGKLLDVLCVLRTKGN